MMAIFRPVPQAVAKSRIRAFPVSRRREVLSVKGQTSAKVKGLTKEMGHVVKRPAQIPRKSRR